MAANINRGHGPLLHDPQRRFIKPLRHNRIPAITQASNVSLNHLQTLMTQHTFIPASLDLRTDPRARQYVKQEVVDVRFAATAGSIQSREGANRYAAGDALITGSTGDHWSVSRDRFDAKYLPMPGVVHGQDGQYQNKLMPVLAMQQTQAFAVERSQGGDIIHGHAGDWLMQYAPGDHGIVENSKFQKVYRPT